MMYSMSPLKIYRLRRDEKERTFRVHGYKV